MDKNLLLRSYYKPQNILNQCNNQLTRQQSTGGDVSQNTTGFEISGSGTQISYITTDHYDGNGCIKIVPGAGSARGGRTTTTTAIQGQQYTGSGRFKAVAGTIVRATLRNGAGNVINYAPFTATGEWDLGYYMGTANDTGLKFGFESNDASQPEIHMDSLKIEKGSRTSWCTL